MKAMITFIAILFLFFHGYPQDTPIPKEKFDFALSYQKVAGQQHRKQQFRPQFHYTPIQGEIGDATGLIYYKGQYHLFHLITLDQYR